MKLLKKNYLLIFEKNISDKSCLHEWYLQKSIIVFLSTNQYDNSKNQMVKISNRKQSVFFYIIAKKLRHDWNEAKLSIFTILHIYTFT